MTEAEFEIQKKERVGKKEDDQAQSTIDDQIADQRCSRQSWVMVVSEATR